ncbi:MAG: roadblock/LC7 domain-containing protein [Gammaproteobacteria bacterium]|nr:roadblock/LC7 domain-containing protein [Gammaproteobacteria bacterium]MBU1723195.1 roadblock/LC7 domain-containing protein [Gammaproteobacteria bacterium]MBU2005438.1 roadblock/LC7 domain-containing protein [Gammaproteobacteria bacterium]
MTTDIASRLIADLTKTSDVIEAAAIISTDGLSISSTFSAFIPDEDISSALNAALFSVGLRTSEELTRGQFESILLETGLGYALLLPVNADMFAALLTSKTHAPEELFANAQQLAEKIRQHEQTEQAQTGKQPNYTMTAYDLTSLLADLAEQIEVLFGKRGATSVFRYAGKQMGKRLGKGTSGDVEIARDLVTNFFRSKGFMDSIGIEENRAELTGCQIGLVLRERGVMAGNHPLCHFGFGLIEGVNESVTGKKIITLHVSSEYHEEGITCHETW